MASHILIDGAEEAEEAIRTLRSHTELSIDCEGVQLGRNGELCLLQIATPQKVYLFDVFVLREKVFDLGLRDILEDPQCTKLFYDCRSDCTALMHQYNVEVKGIEDIQLITLLNMKMSGKRWQFVSGLQKCMDYHLKGCGFSSVEKEKVHSTLYNDKNLWKKRPMSRDLLVYAAKDVLYLSPLKEAIYSKIRRAPRSVLVETIKYASTRYADFTRHSGCADDSRYLRTAMIPDRILPDIEGYGSSASFVPFQPTGSKCRSCYWDTDTRGDGQCSRCYKLDQEKGGAGN